MLTRLQSATIRRLVLIALPLAVLLTLALPAISEAHAILLRSDPTRDAQLTAAPAQVRLWFSEDLNPAFSTAAVVNGNNQRVDAQDAHVLSNDVREMDISLMPNLPSAVYVVVWRSDSNADGHVLSGSFLFTVLEPNGTVPTLSGNTLPGQNLLGGSNTTGLYTGQLDGPTTFNLLMITLVELGAVFWVGAQLWLTFVLQLTTEKENDGELGNINKGIQERFEQRFSLPTLLMLALANIGVLVGQALNLTGGQWASAFNLTLIWRLATSGRFGTFWTMRELVIVLALLVALSMVLVKRRPQVINALLPYINLILGLALFLAITMSSHAAAVNTDIVIYAVVLDWLHLVAAALWVGGMMYIATSYLPTLRRSSLRERTHSLITLLPRYSPLAIGGVLIMATSGPFSAAFHLTSFNQLFDTTYGKVLTIKSLLVGALLVTSAIHVGLLRPRLKKEYKKYSYAVEHIQFNQAKQVKLREERLAGRTQRLTTILRWEPVLGVAVLVCVGLMNVFAGTLSPIVPTTQQLQQSTGTTTATGQVFQTTVNTADSKFAITLNVNPNRFGPNVFTVSVVVNSTHQPATNIGVSLYTTMLDMDMGTDTVNLLPDGKGHFSARGDLGMPGHWQIHVQIRTPDARLHDATVKFATGF